jgi:hypothetical protein
MLKRALLILFTTWISVAAYATEGMWLPLLLQQLNEQEMQSMGMKMSAEDIYSVNKGSLKDAIVHFGGFCTGEIISNQGLILTNHHCGYRQIQSHSSLENNLLEDGFWAKSKAEELPNPGLFVTFIIRIEEVTDKMMANIKEDMIDKEKQSWLDKNRNDLIQNTKREAYQDVMVRSFFDGNQYFMFVTETYNDVRLVGAPPSSIGKFGADTDNWVWPRHTGDFSLFRVYAGPDNKPAEYSEDNIPFTPRHHLPVSTSGVKAGDFTMVFGFPGRTEEYLPYAAVEQRINTEYPIRIAVRDRSLNVLDEAMRADAAIKIKYASKQSGISNAWKKWIGAVQGIKATGGLERKQAYDERFNKMVNANPEWKEKYGTILSDFEALYAKLKPLTESQAYLSEITGRNIELFSYLNVMKRVVSIYESSGGPGVAQRMDRIRSYVDDFFKDYEKEVDKKVFVSVMELYYSKVNPEHLSKEAITQYTMAGKDIEKLADLMYRQSYMLDKDKVYAAMDSGPEALVSLIQKDHTYHYVSSISDKYEADVLAPYRDIKSQIDELQKSFMKAQMEVFTNKRFYPDANGTMRVTYGKVAGYTPRDAVNYNTHTYLEGVMEKYIPGDYEFDVPEKLLTLYREKDYGDYADNGKLPICFIGTNHTSGGNSGSPAIDAEGRLVGLNFDRVWEGTMSDFYYDASICRNIMVDIRYILFIVDKFAGAGHLVEEMDLVK